METLTLARFILETSLMEYDLLDVKDSLAAASALMLAFLLQNNTNEWTPTLEYYSNFKKEDLRETTMRFHSMLNKMKNKNLKTIRNKYSHK
jgi:G2/mitotic-specific cyclin-B3